jgi:hypothetical protein
MSFAIEAVRARIEELMEEDPEAAEQLIQALSAGPDGAGRNLQ